MHNRLRLLYNIIVPKTQNSTIHVPIRRNMHIYITECVSLAVVLAHDVAMECKKHYYFETTPFQSLIIL